MAEAQVAGRLEIPVIADLSGFEKDLRTKVDKAAKNVQAQVLAVIDGSQLEKQLRKAVEDAQRNVKATVEAVVDAKKFEASLRKAVTDAQRGVTASIEVEIDADGLREKLRLAVEEAQAGQDATVEIALDVDRDGFLAELRAAILEGKALAAANPIEVPANVDARGGIVGKIKDLFGIARSTAKQENDRDPVDVAVDVDKPERAPGLLKRLLGRLRKDASAGVTVPVNVGAAAAGGAANAGGGVLGALLGGRGLGRLGRIALTYGALGTLIVPVVDTLSSTLTAIASTIGPLAQTSGALGAMPGLIGAIVSAFAAGKIAASGFGDAVGAIKEANDTAGKTVEQIARDQEALEKALSKLSPSARDAAREVVNLGKAFGPVREAVQEGFFAQLAGHIEEPLKRAIPALTKGLSGVSTELGRAAAAITHYIGSAEALSKIETIFESNRKIVARLGGASKSFLSALMTVLVASAPFAERVATAVENFAFTLNQTLDRKLKDGSLAKFFENGFTQANRLWDMTKDLTSALGGIFGAGMGTGNALLDDLAVQLDRLDNWANSPNGQKAIKKFFEDSVPIAKEFLGLLGDIVMGILSITGDPATANLLKQIREDLLPAIGTFLEKLSKLAPQVIGIISEVARVLGQIGEGAIPTFSFFLRGIAGAFKVLGQVFDEHPGLATGIGAVIGVFAGAAAVIGTIRLLTKVLGLKGLAGALTSMGGKGVISGLANITGLAALKGKLAGLAAVFGLGSAAGGGKNDPKAPKDPKGTQRVVWGTVKRQFGALPVFLVGGGPDGPDGKGKGGNTTVIPGGGGDGGGPKPGAKPKLGGRLGRVIPGRAVGALIGSAITGGVLSGLLPKKTPEESSARRARASAQGARALDNRGVVAQIGSGVASAGRSTAGAARKLPLPKPRVPGRLATVFGAGALISIAGAAFGGSADAAERSSNPGRSIRAQDRLDAARKPQSKNSGDTRGLLEGLGLAAGGALILGRKKIPGVGKAFEKLGTLGKSLPGGSTLAKVGRAVGGIGGLAAAFLADPIAKRVEGNKKNTVRRGLGGAIRGGANGAAVGGLVGSVVPVVGTAVGTAVGGAAGAIIGGLNAAMPDLSKKVTGAAATIGGLAAGAVSKAGKKGKAFKWVADHAGDAVKAVGPQISKVGPAIGSGLGRAKDVAGKAMSGLGRVVTQGLVPAVKGAGSKAKEIAGGIGNGLKDAGKAAGTRLAEVGKAARDKLGAAVTEAKTKAGQVATGIRDNVGKAKGYAQAKFGEVTSAARDKLAGTVNEAKTKATSVASGIRDKLAASKGYAQTKFGEVTSAARDKLSGTVTEAKTKATSVATGIRDKLGATKGYAQTAMSDAKAKITGGLSQARVDGGRFAEAVSKRLGDGFAKAKELAAVPLRWVINNPIDGLRKVFNAISGKIGGPKLDPVKANFAKGGEVGRPRVYPGYAPGRDTIRAMVSPGEGVLVPEAMRGLARKLGMAPGAAIQKLNSMFSSRVSGPSERPKRNFALGGLVDDDLLNGAKGVLGKAGDGLAAIGGGIKDVFVGGLRKVFDAALGPVNGLIDRVPGGSSVMTGMAKAGGKTLVKAAGDWLTNKDKEAPTGGSPNGLGGLGPRARAAADAVRRIFGFQGTIGGYSNRNIAGTSKLSKHALGKAIDVMTYGNMGLGQRIADYFRQNRSSFGVDNVIFNRRIWNAGAPGGKGYAGQNPHLDHPHIDFFAKGGLVPGMAAGGTILPRRGGTLARLAEAGRAETVVDTGKMNELMDRVLRGKAGTQGGVVFHPGSVVVNNPVPEPASNIHATLRRAAAFGIHK